MGPKMYSGIDFDYLKSKQAIVSGVLQQIDNLYIYDGLHPPHFLLQILTRPKSILLT